MPAGIIPEPAAFLLPPGTLTTPSLSFLHRSAGGLLGYACGAVVCNVLRAAAQDIMVALGRLLFPAFPTRPCECHALSPFLFSFIRSPARASERVGVVWWCGPPHSQRAAGLAGQATNYTSSRLASLLAAHSLPGLGPAKRYDHRQGRATGHEPPNGATPGARPSVSTAADGSNVSVA